MRRCKGLVAGSHLDTPGELRDMTPFMAFDRPVREAENRLERFNADRERLLAEVERRVVARRVSESRAGSDASLEYVLNDVAFCEIRRLEASKNNGAADRWRDLSRRLLQMSDEDKQGELRSLVRHYGQDVVGNFDPRVYRFATGLGPSILGFVFSADRQLARGRAGAPSSRRAHPLRR